MVKNRRITYCKGPQKKKVCTDEKLSSNEHTNRNQEKDLVSDGLLSLYKKDLEEKIGKSKFASPLPTRASEAKEIVDIKEKSKFPVSNIEALKTPLKTPKRIKKKESSVKKPTVTFDAIGGLEEETACILDMCLHLKYPMRCKKAGIPSDRGFLLHGPPGCGKTLLAHATAGTLELPLVEVAVSSLLFAASGDTIGNLQEFFEEALLTAPCILFIDQIDAISSSNSREGPEGRERRMVTQLVDCFEELNAKDPANQVKIIGSTNRIDSIDLRLRRSKRFDHEIALTMPNEDGRLKILQILCKNLQLAPDCDLNWLAQITPGFSGADLSGVVSRAVKPARQRLFRGLAKEQKSSEETQEHTKFSSDTATTSEIMFWLKNIKDEDNEYRFVFMQQDFEQSIRNYIPCAMREGYPSIPNVTWSDVGALKEARGVIESSVLWPVKHRKFFEMNNFQSASGILLCGPKGCGKTLLAKAIANEAGINFLSVKGPELLNMYLGESEKSVRQCFLRARNSAPCIIFFDEIDALCSSRSSSNVNAASDRVVTQLLTEMEGVEDRKQVFVMAATNRPEKIDSAMLRPGRLDRILFIDVPSKLERVDILKSLTKNKTGLKFAENLDLETVALDTRCNGFSGADLSFLLREAFNYALKDYFSRGETSEDESVELCSNHFDTAFTIVKPSVSEEERRQLKENYLSLTR